MAFKDSTDEKFQEQISGNKLSLIQFSASWCGPCQQLKPIIEKISNEKADLMFKLLYASILNTSGLYVLILIMIRSLI
jgi:thiol-disulfide isomerase/thioredoxin